MKHRWYWYLPESDYVLRWQCKDCFKTLAATGPDQNDDSECQP